MQHSLPCVALDRVLAAERPSPVSSSSSNPPWPPLLSVGLADQRGAGYLGSSG
jgi:hypothetical protein